MADNTTNSSGIPGSSFTGTTSPGGEFTPGAREGFSNHPHFEGYEREGISDSGSMTAGIGAAVSRYVSTYDTSLRANPWLHIGLAGAGALVLGYVLGRATSSSTVTPIRGMSEIDLEAAYDE